MTASRLRSILIVVVIILFGSLGAGIWWMQQQLAFKVQETDHARIDAELAAGDIEKLRNLQTQLAQGKDTVERAQQIAASASQYKYQDQVIHDVTVYAGRQGIVINAFDFSAANIKKGGNEGAATKTPFTVNLRGPISFAQFMAFVRDVERNLTKIQVTSISLSPDSKNPANISNPSLNLEVYIKS